MTAADLTAIEAQVLVGLLAGKGLKQIAAERGRHYNCITRQLFDLRKKLGLNNNIQLGAWAERHGIREQA